MQRITIRNTPRGHVMQFGTGSDEYRVPSPALHSLDDSLIPENGGETEFRGEYDATAKSFTVHESLETASAENSDETDDVTPENDYERALMNIMSGEHRGGGE